jgi:hypothetical protein
VRRPVSGGAAFRHISEEEIMRKMPALALIILTALLIGGVAAPLLLRAQTATPGRGSGAAAVENDVPHRTARSFAPFIRALMQRRLTTAQQLFKVHRPVLETLDLPDVMRILQRYQRPQQYELNLVAGRLYAPNTGIVLFTIVNEEGPVYFKIHYYTYAEKTYIDGLEISDDWGFMEAAAEHLESLPAPISVPVNSAEVGGGM